MTEYSNLWQDAQDFMTMFWNPPGVKAEQQQPPPPRDSEPDLECIRAIVRCYQ